jgi:hypothetical protein
MPLPSDGLLSFFYDAYQRGICDQQPYLKSSVSPTQAYKGLREFAHADGMPLLIYIQATNDQNVADATPSRLYTRLHSWSSPIWKTRKEFRA